MVSLLLLQEATIFSWMRMPIHTVTVCTTNPNLPLSRGGLLTRCCRRFIPCKTASIISSGDLAWRQSRVSSAASIILRMALIEEALCAWLYWYAALVLSGALAISDTHDCCAAHSVLPIMAVALRLLCTLTSNIADFPPWRRTF